MCRPRRVRQPQWPHRRFLSGGGVVLRQTLAVFDTSFLSRASPARRVRARLGAACVFWLGGRGCSRSLRPQADLAVLSCCVQSQRCGCFDCDFSLRAAGRRKNSERARAPRRFRGCSCHTRTASVPWLLRSSQQRVSRDSRLPNRREEGAQALRATVGATACAHPIRSAVQTSASSSSAAGEHVAEPMAKRPEVLLLDPTMTFQTPEEQAAQAQADRWAEGSMAVDTLRRVAWADYAPENRLWDPDGVFFAWSTLMSLTIDLRVSGTWPMPRSVHDAGACRFAPAPLGGLLLPLLWCPVPSLSPPTKPCCLASPLTLQPRSGIAAGAPDGPLFQVRGKSSEILSPLVTVERPAAFFCRSETPTATRVDGEIRPRANPTPASRTHRAACYCSRAVLLHVGKDAESRGFASQCTFWQLWRLSSHVCGSNSAVLLLVLLRYRQRWRVHA